MSDKRIRIILDSKKAESDAKSLDKAMVGVGSSADKAQFSLNKLAAAIGAAIAVDKVLAYADAFTSVQNQIRRTTDNQDQLNKSTAELLKISNETRTGLLETTELYTSLAVSTKNLGYTQEQVFGITKTINNLFLESGKTAQESAGAIKQLGQALQSGTLRGDEFNSIAEGAPGILRAIQLETGKSAGALRDFAATGGITAELLTKSLENYADTAQKAADKTKATLSQSFVVAKNNATFFIGSVDKAVGITSELSKEIINLSNRLASTENIQNFIQFFKEANIAIDATRNDLKQFSTQLDAISDTGSSAIEFIGTAFRDLVPNVRASIQLIVVEALSAFDKLKLGAKSIFDFRQNPFTFLKQIDVFKDKLGQINDIRESSIEQIIKERDTIIQAAAAEAKAKAEAAKTPNSNFGTKGTGVGTATTVKIGGAQSDTANLQSDLNLRLRLNKIFLDTQIARDADYYQKKKTLLDRSQEEQLAKLQDGFEKENTNRKKKLAEALQTSGVNAAEQKQLQEESQKQAAISAKIYEQEKTDVMRQGVEDRTELAKEEAKFRADAAQEIDSARQITASLKSELDQRSQASQLYVKTELDKYIDYYTKVRTQQTVNEAIATAALEQKAQEDEQRRQDQFRQALDNDKLTNDERAALRAQYDQQEILAAQIFEEQKNQIKNEGIKARQDLDQAEFQSRLSNTAALGNALMTLGEGHNKKIFKIGQKLALAQAYASLPSAVLQSFENGGGYPWGLIPAAAMLATGIANIQKIKSAGSGLGVSGGGGGGGAVISGGGGAGSIPTGTNSLDQAPTQKKIYDIRGVNPGDLVTVETLTNLLEDDGAVVAISGAMSDAQRRNVIGVTAR